MKKQILVFDLDGTLISKNNLPTKNSIKILNQIKNKAYIVIATGRGVDESFYLQKYIDIDYFILNNGALIYDNQKKLFIQKNLVDDKITKFLFKKAYENNLRLAFHNEKGCYHYYEDDKKLSTVLSKADLLNLVLNNNAFISASLVAIKVNKEFEKYKKELELISNDLQINNSFNYLDVHKKNCDKANAISFLYKYLRLNNSDCHVFGDSSNDLKMLSNFDNSYAMENGTTEAKKVAKTIIGNNDSDAIYLSLKKIFNL